MKFPKNAKRKNGLSSILSVITACVLTLCLSFATGFSFIGNKPTVASAADTQANADTSLGASGSTDISDTSDFYSQEKSIAKIFGVESVDNIENELADNVSADGGSSISGDFKVTKNTTVGKSDKYGVSGIVISGTVRIYIAPGITLTVRGGNASGTKGAGAGINLPSGATLELYGSGTISARGGDAASGGAGGNVGSGNNSYLTRSSIEWGNDDGGMNILIRAAGSGGYGGGGAGAGIGGKGGTGGETKKSTFGDYNYNYLGSANTDQMGERLQGSRSYGDDYNRSANGGNAGGAGEGMGTLNIYNSVIVSATGGSNGSGGAGGSGEKYSAFVFQHRRADGSGDSASYVDRAYVTTSGAGGGGGGGGSAYGIGSGGGGGASGGAGIMGNRSRITKVSDSSSTEFNMTFSAGQNLGAGGEGGSGVTSGARGSDGNANQDYAIATIGCGGKKVGLMCTDREVQYNTSGKATNGDKSHTWTFSYTRSVYEAGRAGGGGISTTGTVNNYSNRAMSAQNTVNNHTLNVILDPITYAKDVLKASTTFNVKSNSTVLRGVTDGNKLTFASKGVETTNLATITSAIDTANSNGVSTDDFWADSSEYTNGNGGLLTTGLASYYSKPDLPGYDFTGYYVSTAEDAEMAIDANMNINPNFYFNKASVGSNPTVGGTQKTGLYKLYAHYTPKTYTVNFNANGGTVTPAGSFPSEVYTFDGGYAIPNNKSGSTTMTKKGYTFAGWSDNDYVDYDVDNGFSVKYGLDDNGNGLTIYPGSGTDKLQQNYNMNIPRGEYKASAMVYAAWKKTISVDPEQYTGTNFVQNGITVYYNTQLPLLNKLYERAPMNSLGGIDTITFDGIYTEKNGQGNNIWDKVGNVASGAEKWTYDTDTVYFKWVGTFSLDMNTKNGSTPSKPSTSVTGWTNLTNQKFTIGQGYSKGSTRFPSPTRVGYKLIGYTFNNFYTDPSEADLFLDQNGAFITGKATSQDGALDNDNNGYRVLYAVWQPEEYEVKLLANFDITFSSGSAKVSEYLGGKGGTHNLQTVKVKFDQRFPELDKDTELPKLEGFEFEGYSVDKVNRIFYISSEGTPSADRWLDSDFLDSTGNAKSLYAHWKQILYTAKVAVIWQNGYISDMPVSLVRRSSYKVDGVIQPEANWVKYTMTPNTDGPYTAQVPRGEYVLMVDGYVYEDTFTDLEVYNADLTIESATPYIFNKLTFRVTGDGTLTFAVNLRSNTQYKNQRQFRSDASYWIFHNEEATIEQITTFEEITTTTLRNVLACIGADILDQDLIANPTWLTTIVGDLERPVVGKTVTLSANNWTIKFDCRSIITEIGFNMATPVGGEIVGDYVFQSTKSSTTVSYDKGPFWSVNGGSSISSTSAFGNGVVYRVTFYIRATGLSEFATADRITVTIYNGNKETVYKYQADGNIKSFTKLTGVEAGIGYDVIEVTYIFDKTAAKTNRWTTDGNPWANGGVYDWNASPVTVGAKALYGDYNVLFGKVGEATESDNPLDEKNKFIWTSDYPTHAGNYYVFFYVEETDAYTGLVSSKIRITITKYNIVIGDTDGGRVTYDGKTHSSTLASSKYGDFPEDVLTITSVKDVIDAGSYEIKISLKGIYADDYMINDSNVTEVTTNFVIDKAKLTISMIDFTETYGYEISESDLTKNNVRIEGLADRDQLSTALQLSNGSGLQSFTFRTSYDTGILGKRSVGTYDIEIVENFLSKNYTYQLIAGTFEITKKTIYVSTPDVTKEYGDEIEFEYSIDIEHDGGILLFDDTRGSVFGSHEVIQAVNFDSGNVKCGTYRLQLNPSLNARVTNYEVVLQSSSSFTLNRHRIVITADDIHITYGDSLSASAYGYTVSGVNGAQGLVHGDTFDDLVVRYTTNKLKNMISVSSNYNTTSAALRGAGTQPIHISGPAETENYIVTYVDGTLEVAKAMLTVKVDNKNIYYGTDTPNAYEYTVTGWKYTADNESVIDRSERVYDCNYDSSDPNNRHVSTYYVYVSGLSADNYEFTYQRGVLTVDRLPITLKPTFIDLTYGDKTLKYNFEFTGNKVPYEDLASLINGVAFSWRGDSVVSLDLLNVGNYAVVFGQNLSVYANNYDITVPTNVEINIVKRGATITMNNLSAIYGTDNADLNAFTFTTTNMLERDAATLRSMLAQVGALLTTYDSTNPALRKATDYNIYVDRNYVLEEITKNYDITYVDGTLTINKKSIVIGMDDVEIIYGEEFDPSSVNLILVDSEWEYSDDFENFGLAIIKTASKFNGTDKLYDYDSSNFAHRQGGTYTVVLSVNADHENYELVFASGTLKVLPRKVNVVVQNKEITYGDVFDKNELEYTFSAVNGDSKSGLVSGDLDWLKTKVAITVGYDSTIYSKRTVGGYDFVVSAMSNDNYEILVAEDSGKLTVVQRGIVVKVDAKTTTYGLAAPSFTVTYQGKLGDNDATYLNPNVTYICDYRKLDNGKYTNVNAGKYEIRIDSIKGDRAQNYVFEFQSDYLTVEKATLYLELNDMSLVYGSAKPLQSAYSIKGKLGTQYDDDQTLDDLLKIRYSTDYDLYDSAKRNVGTYNISAALIEQLQNYDVIFTGNNANGDGSILTVTKKPLMITAVDKQITYGQSVEYTFSTNNADGNDGLENFDYELAKTIKASCNYLAVAKNTYRNAGLYTIKPVIDNDLFSNYSVTLVDGALTVDKKILTVTAQDQTLIYGQPLLPISVVYAGWEYGEDTKELTGTLGYDTNYDRLVAEKRGVGVYEIEPKGLSATNYQIEYVKGKVTVNPKPLTITADSLEITYGDAVPTELFKLRNNKSGDYEYGETVADLFGTVNYVTDYNTTLVSTRGVGTYYVRPSGLTSNNYALEFEDGVLTVVKKKLDIQVNRNTIVYGDKVEHTVEYAGFAFDDNKNLLEGKLNFVTLYNPEVLENRKVDSYNVRAEGYNSANYNIIYHDATLYVVKKDLTITTDPYTIIWGDKAPVYEAVYGRFAFDEDETYLDGMLEIVCGYNRYDDRGDYAIVLSGLSSDNYNVIFVDSNLHVNPLTVGVPSIGNMSYTGATLVPEVPSSEYYFVKTNDGGINVGRYSVILSLENYPNVVWADDESSADKEVFYEIIKTYYLVSFEQEGGNYVKGDLTQRVLMGDFVVEANIPTFTRTGFTFGGWFTDKAFTNKFSVTAPINADTVLYGFWVKNDNALAGRVVNPDDAGIAEVTVTVIKNGKVLFTALTNDEGYFSTEGIVAGLYNFAIAYSAGDLDRAAAFAIDVTGDYDEMIKIVVDPQNVNTRVVVKSEGIDFVADDLTNAFTKADLENVRAGGSVEFLVDIVENKFDRVNDFSNAAGLDRKDVNGYFTIKASKQVTDVTGKVTSSEVTETAGLVKYVVKLDENSVGKSGYVLYRALNDGTFEVIGEKANDNGEYVKLSQDGKSLEMYVLATGDYAIGYDTANLSVMDWAHIAGGAGVLTIIMLVAWIAVARRRRNG